MRVAVVSPPNRQTGKTALALMLANLYPHATNRESVYVTNKSLNEVLTLDKFVDETTKVEKSITVITALSMTGEITDRDIIDYAYRPKEAKSMLFDIYSPTAIGTEAFDSFMAVVNKFGNRFVIMDLNGDPDSKKLKPFIDVCDVVLYIFSPIKSECDSARKYYDSLDEVQKLKTKLLCNKLDDAGVSKKTVQDYIKIRANSILWFPYNEGLKRVMFEGRIGILPRLIIEGKDNCLSLRQPIKDILSYLCDSKNIKVVKEVTKWEI